MEIAFAHDLVDTIAGLIRSRVSTPYGVSKVSTAYMNTREVFNTIWCVKNNPRSVVNARVNRSVEGTTLHMPKEHKST